MADNLHVREGSATDPSIRTREISSGIHAPIYLVGEHVRVYDDVQSIAATSSVQTLTVPGSATHAEIYMEGTASTSYVRYWHGTDPSATVGIRLFDDQQINSATPSQFRFVNGSGTGNVIRANYYHYA